MITGAWVCLLAPLAGFLAILLAGTRITRRHAGIVSTASVFVGFAGALVAFLDAWSRDPDDRTELTTAWTWLKAGEFEVGLQLLVDPLSLVMMLIVTGVGGLIVLYSNGYMAGEDEERRYFAYMAFFVFSMLMLVMGGNLLLLLVGWGLVGLASYLLIGYYHDRTSAVAAAKKAFVINALGDAIMALGFFLLIAKLGSLDFGVVFDAAESGELSDTVVTLAALALLGGAVAKSAQIPFHTWLPDAMEGPTPVSALIHAATMVTAGVYLICRTHPVFEAAPDVQHLAAIIGMVTLLVAGVVALVQWDIKRVIAYSTMSQIGYMFVGAGVGAYGFAMFHLFTHAFFKALLFLAAGMVIHHLDGEQDIRKMGGLKSSMPFTHVTFLVGTLALIGIPPLSGFWSKDAIVSSAGATGGVLGWTLYVGCLVGALLTGLYAMRLYFYVFRGEPAAGAAPAVGRARPPRRGPAVDEDPGRRPGGRLGDRRVPPDPRRLGALRHVDRPRRRAARASLRRGGLPDEPLRGDARHDRHLPRLAGVHRGPRARPLGRCPHGAGAQALVRRALRRRLLAAGAGDRRRAARPLRGPRRPGRPRRGGGGDAARRRRHVRGAERPPADLRPRDHDLGRRPRPRLPGRALMLTTLLIVVPLAGALLVWIAPVSRDSTAGLALLVALAEVGLWLGSTRNFDFGSDVQQYSASQEWFEELGISYAVGLYGFQFWLVGLTVVVGACAIGYGAWANRDRARAYFGLMLFLVGSLVGVFASQDLVLFYVFFEAMLIPIYVLVGVWGGPGRVKATVTFVLYTMAGSLLMLASIIAFGISQGTFLLSEIGTSSNDLIFLGFMAAFAVKAPLLPFHGWLRSAYTEAPPEVAALLSGVVSKAAVFGLVWIVLPHFPEPVDNFRGLVLVLAAATLVYGSVLAFRQPDIRGVVAYSSMGQMGLIVLGIFAVNDLGLDGAVLHSVNHGLVSAGLFLLAGMIETRTGTGAFAQLGGLAKGRPILATLVLVLGMYTLAVPGSSNFAGEFAILAGVFQHGWGYAAVGAAAIVLAALYALRLISAILHERRGASVREEPDDLVSAELMLVVPLVAILAVLSAWPAAISERSFPADAPSAFIGSQSGEGLLP